MSETHHFRPCCSDAHERRGDAAPILGDAIGRLLPGDFDLPPVPVAMVRQPANARQHEVGHCLVTLALGGVVGLVTVEGQALAECKLAEGAPWQHRVAVDLAGDAATVGDLADAELSWHIAAVRLCGGGLCDRCRAVRSITVGLRHPPDDVVIAEFRRIEAALAEFFARIDVRSLVSDIAWDLFDEGTITGEYIEEHFGSRVRELKLEI